MNPTRGKLVIGRQSAGFVDRGHPWIKPDRFTKGLELLHAGQVVDLFDEHGRAVATALADPQAPVCARVCGRSGSDFSPELALSLAWKRRGDLTANRETDCFRLVHGEGDGLPGFRIERYGPCLIIEVRAACAQPWVERVAAAVNDLAKPEFIIIKDHQRDLRQEAVRCRRWDGGPVDAQLQISGRELGVRYRISPASGLATGLYVDQRATRQWLAARVGGKQVLNLFAYTGAFACSALRAGAAAVTDVDLSAPALALALGNITDNELHHNYQAVRSDVMAFINASATRWDVVICDPPTAAQGGGGGWVVRRDYPALLTQIAARLKPGGLVIACCNTIGQPFALREAVAASGLRVIAGPELGHDIVQRPGFPEGRPYRLTAAVAG